MTEERGEWLCDVSLCGRSYNLFAIAEQDYRLGIWYVGTSQVREEVANARELEMGLLIKKLEREIAQLKKRKGR